MVSMVGSPHSGVQCGSIYAGPVPPLRLLVSHLEDPVEDTALSTALLHRVASGEVGPTLRLFTPGRIVAFGSQDRTRPGYPKAVASAGDVGFAAVERLAGGRAAVFHEGTVAFAWAIPHPEPKQEIESRFRAITAIVTDALDRLGMSAGVGEIEGEYCPGRFSVHSRGRKVMGVGQRLIAGAAHVGGVLVVHSSDLVNLPLIPVYRHLGYEWDPAVTGALDGGTTIADATEALKDAFESAGHSLEPVGLDTATLEAAGDLADRHRPRIP